MSRSGTPVSGSCVVTAQRVDLLVQAARRPRRRERNRRPTRPLRAARSRRPRSACRNAPLVDVVAPRLTRELVHRCVREDRHRTATAQQFRRVVRLDEPQRRAGIFGDRFCEAAVDDPAANRARPVREVAPRPRRRRRTSSSTTVPSGKRSASRSRPASYVADDHVRAARARSGRTGARRSSIDEEPSVARRRRRASTSISSGCTERHPLHRRDRQTGDGLHSASPRACAPWRRGPRCRARRRRSRGPVTCTATLYTGTSRSRRRTCPHERARGARGPAGASGSAPSSRFDAEERPDRLRLADERAHRRRVVKQDDPQRALGDRFAARGRAPRRRLPSRRRPRAAAARRSPAACEPGKPPTKPFVPRSRARAVDVAPSSTRARARRRRRFEHRARSRRPGSRASRGCRARRTPAARAAARVARARAPPRGSPCVVRSPASRTMSAASATRANASRCGSRMRSSACTSPAAAIRTRVIVQFSRGLKGAHVGYSRRHDGGATSIRGHSARH